MFFRFAKLTMAALLAGSVGFPAFAMPMTTPSVQNTFLLVEGEGRDNSASPAYRKWRYNQKYDRRGMSKQYRNSGKNHKNSKKYKKNRNQYRNHDRGPEILLEFFFR